MSWGFPYDYMPRIKLDPRRQLAQLRKKNPDIRPVLLAGRKIAKTWWGEAWNKNLERYSDYANRLPRGRTYVRAGNVLDLQISAGTVRAQVLGSALYDVEITIRPLSGKNWAGIVEACGHQIGGLAALAAGKFPEELGKLFTARDSGLFPTPEDMRFRCSCPDWADMCKHVAAALYGVGARLDEQPTLFFTLRDIRFEELLKKSVESKMQQLLKNAGKMTGRVISGQEAEALFAEISDSV